MSNNRGARRSASAHGGSSSGRLLIISFSVIESDARVLKQIKHFSEIYDVTTCGYGPPVEGTVQHYRVPDDLGHAELYGRYITLHWYRAAYWRLPAMRWVRDTVPAGEWDVVLANELETMPLALGLRPRGGIHLDLHEYTPLLNAEHEGWRRRIKPYHEWMCRRYATKAGSWSTVSSGLSREYATTFGFEPDVVTNAAPFADLEPGPVDEPIRLVHSGACLRNRQLMTMLDAVEHARRPVTFDLYLTPNDPGYLEELRLRAAAISGVEVRDPVPYRELVTTLNAYDVGIHLLAPTNFNNEWALPNKLFDYVQARLGILIGPSPEMAERVRAYGLGSVAEEFSADALAAQIDGLTIDCVAEYKEASHAHARELSAESQIAVWDRAIAALFAAIGRSALTGRRAE